MSRWDAFWLRLAFALLWLPASLSVLHVVLNYRNCPSSCTCLPYISQDSREWKLGLLGQAGQQGYACFRPCPTPPLDTQELTASEPTGVGNYMLVSPRIEDPWRWQKMKLPEDACLQVGLWVSLAASLPWGPEQVLHILRSATQDPGHQPGGVGGVYACAQYTVGSPGFKHSDEKRASKQHLPRNGDATVFPSSAHRSGLVS